MKKFLSIFCNKYMAFLGVFISIVTVSIGYSALESRLNIAGDVSIRVNADIRITSFKVSRLSNGAYETYSATYSKNITNVYASLPDSSSVAVYDGVVTNYSDKRYYLKEIIVNNYTNKDIAYVVEKLTPGKIIEPNSTFDFDIKLLYVDRIPNDDSTTLVLKYVFEEYVEESSEDMLLKDKILLDNGGSSSIESKSVGDFTSISSTNEGMYAASDDDDTTTYYFRGSVDNNYVLFGGFYWRIVRINGNGSIRLIYQGSSATSSGSDCTIGSEIYKSVTVFNNDKSNPSHTVYNSSSAVRGGYLGNSGLDAWYKSNMVNYDSSIDYDAGFCNDVADSSGTNQVSSSSSSSITYGGKYRLETSHTPSFKCAASGYYYTYKSASSGNKDLSYPIGNITLDEAYAAGGYSANNTSYYLYCGASFWTMTPYNYTYGLFGLGKGVYVSIIDSNGMITSSKVQNSNNIRPVINLKSSVIYNSGDGTSSSPYTIGGKKIADPTGYYGNTLVNAIVGMHDDGDDYIILHDSSISTSAQDGSYRYSGANPNNYVCFGSDDSTCPEDNLYRIIGVIDGKVKLVSADYAGSSMLGTSGGYIGDYSSTSATYASSTSDIKTYAYNNSDGESSKNDWSSSLLNSTNLNGYFLDTLSDTWKSKIVSTKWYVGNVNYFTSILSTPSKVYSEEINSSQTTYDAKVGLLYAHEYGFGASESAWGAYMNSYGNSNIRSNNWLYLGLTEWMISHGSGGDGNNAATFSSDGGIGYQKVYNGLPVRITFSIDSSVVLNSGTGSSTDPYRIS